MNVYSGDHQSVVKFMLDQVINIPNLLYMDGDLNVRDAEWDPLVISHPATGQALMDLVDSFGLVRSLPALPVPTHYSDSKGHVNSVIDLNVIILCTSSVLLYYSEQCSPSLKFMTILLEYQANIMFFKKVLKFFSQSYSQDFIVHTYWFVTESLFSFQGKPSSVFTTYTVIGDQSATHKLKPRLFHLFIVTSVINT